MTRVYVLIIVHCRMIKSIDRVRGLKVNLMIECTQFSKSFTILFKREITLV